MKDNNQGFPPALTHENLAAALKRAADAEDHLRREVASNQALVALVKDFRIDMKVERALGNDMIRERDAELQKARCVISERDETIFKLQGALIAHSEMIKARDQTIADLQDDIQNWKDRVLDKG